MSKPVQENEPSRASRPAGEVPPVVAANVRRLREGKGYSLEQLALASGLGRSGLEALESGAGEPTIKVLWSVANALEVPFSALLSSAPRAEAEPATSPERQKQQAARTQGNSGASVVHELKLAAHSRASAAPRAAGAIENVLVTSGVAIIEAGGARYSLKAGQSRAIAADVERHYRNDEQVAASLYIVVTHA